MRQRLAELLLERLHDGQRGGGGSQLLLRRKGQIFVGQLGLVDAVNVAVRDLKWYNVVSETLSITCDL